MRSQPRVSESSVKYTPLLPAGTMLRVIEGPVQGSGYQWYRVTPVSFALDGSVGEGWVAAADHDGTLWIARVLFTVRAYIDGRSVLRVWPDRAQWRHISSAAPGRHGTANHPTYLNGVGYVPEWDVPPATVTSPPDGELPSEMRDCGCTSSVFAVGEALHPASTRELGLWAADARGSVVIVRQPTAGNDYSVRIEVDDEDLGGPAWYEVVVTLGGHQAVGDQQEIEGP